MFAKKKTLLEQASDLAQDVADALAPHVDNAREQIGPRLSDARDKAGPLLADARDKAGPLLSDARDKAGPLLADARDKAVPLLADARDKAVPLLADARDKAAPHVADARDRLVNDVLPAAKAAASSAVAQASEQAAPVAEEAKRRSRSALHKLKGEQPEPKGGKKKKLLFLVVIAGVAAAVAKKLSGGKQASTWQSTYTPPTPAPRPTTVTDSGDHRGDVPVDSPSSVGTEAGAGTDAAGGTPGEALSDSSDEPHEVTTPDAPTETVDLGLVDTPSATPYGEGSALPNADGSAPEGFEIKGNRDSMKFHAPSSPWYDRTKAEVWFANVEAAQSAGFVNAEKDA